MSFFAYNRTGPVVKSAIAHHLQLESSGNQTEQHAAKKSKKSKLVPIPESSKELTTITVASERQRATMKHHLPVSQFKTSIMIMQISLPQLW